MYNTQDLFQKAERLVLDYKRLDQDSKAKILNPVTGEYFRTAFELNGQSGIYDQLIKAMVARHIDPAQSEEVLDYFHRARDALLEQRVRIGRVTAVKITGNSLEKRTQTVGKASDANIPDGYDEFLREHTGAGQAPGFKPGETGILYNDPLISRLNDKFMADAERILIDFFRC
jgi:hypothetical protein